MKKSNPYLLSFASFLVTLVALSPEALPSAAAWATTTAARAA